MIARTRLRVLLVEDNELDARAMQRHLRDAEGIDFEVERAADLGSALTAASVDRFDCVLLDLSLPDSSGLASVDALLERAPNTPVVVLTGLDSPETAVQAVEHGAQDYLTKQVVDTELVSRSIRYAVARHVSDTQLRTATEQLHLMSERERIARDLHDTVIQQLFATGMSLQAISNRVEDDECRDRLEQAVDEMDGAIRQLREAIFELHDSERATSVSEEVVRLAGREAPALGFTPTVRLGPGIDDLDDAIGHELVATVTEALSNVARHAGATAAQILVELDAGDVVVQVVDNGRGFDSTTRPPDPLSGNGLVNLDRRAAELTGSFSIGPAPGGGTKLEWRAPVPESG